MINLIKKTILFISFTFLLFVFLTKPFIIVNSVNYSINIFISNILPTLFPFFILADALINYGYISYISRIFRFKYSNLILMSMISGLPSNAKYISSFLSRGLISKRDAEIILSVTFFPNPMFVISSVGALMLGDIKKGMALLVILYLSNAILFIFYYKKLNDKSNYINTETMPFSSFVKSSILKNSEALLVILGTIVIFVTLSNLISNFTNFSPLINSIISSVMEMTSGIKKMSEVNILPSLKFILISISLAFSGCSILIQAFSLLSEHNLNIRFILKNKFIVMLLNLIISYIYVIFFIRV